MPGVSFEVLAYDPALPPLELTTDASGVSALSPALYREYCTVRVTGGTDFLLADDFAFVVESRNTLQLTPGCTVILRHEDPGLLGKTVSYVAAGRGFQTAVIRSHLTDLGAFLPGPFELVRVGTTDLNLRYALPAGGSVEIDLSRVEVGTLIQLFGPPTAGPATLRFVALPDRDVHRSEAMDLAEAASPVPLRLEPGRYTLLGSWDGRSTYAEVQVEESSDIDPDWTAGVTLEAEGGDLGQLETAELYVMPSSFDSGGEFISPDAGRAGRNPGWLILDAANAIHRTLSWTEPSEVGAGRATWNGLPPLARVYVRLRGTRGVAIARGQLAQAGGRTMLRASRLREAEIVVDDWEPAEGEYRVVVFHGDDLVGFGRTRDGRLLLAANLEPGSLRVEIEGTEGRGSAAVDQGLDGSIVIEPEKERDRTYSVVVVRSGGAPLPNVPVSFMTTAGRPAVLRVTDAHGRARFRTDATDVRATVSGTAYTSGPSRLVPGEETRLEADSVHRLLLVNGTGRPLDAILRLGRGDRIKSERRERVFPGGVSEFRWVPPGDYDLEVLEALGDGEGTRTVASRRVSVRPEAPVVKLTYR